MNYDKLVLTKIKNTRKEYHNFVNNYKKELKKSGIYNGGAREELKKYKNNLLEIMVDNLMNEVEEHHRARRAVDL